MFLLSVFPGGVTRRAAVNCRRTLMEKERCRVKTKIHWLRRFLGGVTALATAAMMLPASALAIDTSGYTTPQYVETSGGVMVEASAEIGADWNLYLTVDVTIAEDVVADQLYINLMEEIGDVQINGWPGLQPGDGIVLEVNITNNSEIPYSYQEGSVIFGTSPFDTNDEIYQSVTAFDGYQVYLTSQNNVFRSYNHALEALDIGVDSSFASQSDIDRALTDENIGNALIEAGYSGIEDLDNYYLDYYNQTYNMNITDLQDASDDYLNDLFSCYRPGGGSHAQVGITESNPEIAALGYYYLYNNLITVENISGSSYSIADFMERNSVALSALDAELINELSQLKETGTDSFEILYESDGPQMNNCYQGRVLDLGMQISLENSQPTPDPEPSEPSSDPSSEPEEPPVVIPDDDPSLSIRKVWVEDTEEDRPDSILVEIYHDEELYDTVEVEEKYRWRTSYNIPERYENDDWWVQEADVPEGYEDYIDETRDNVFVITNTYVGVEEESSEESSEPSVTPSEPSVEPSEPSSEPSEPTPEPEEPAEPTLPQTGQVWWPIIILLAGGAVLVAFGAFRTMRGNSRHGR